MKQIWKGLILVAFFVAAAAIGVAARGDLWFDEVWSLSFAETANSWSEIFTRFRHDNNHLLNTLFLRLTGRRECLLFYRALAVVCGIGSVALAGLSARDCREGFFVTAATGCSYPMVLYFSEARGYAPAVFFSLLAFVCLRSSILDRSRYWKLGLYWLAALLGILSHATSVIVLGALGVRAAVRVGRTARGARTRVGGFLVYCGIPAVFVGMFYLLWARHIVIGGGPTYDKWDVVMRATALCLGLPDNKACGVVALFGVVVLVVLGCRLLYREEDDSWFFYPLALFVMPALLLLATRPEHLFFRYFLVCFPFFYILLGRVTAKFFSTGNRQVRCMIVILFAAMLAGHGTRLVPLFRMGRGHYREALGDMADRTNGRVISVGSDNDFRNRMLLEFYSRFLPPDKALMYQEKRTWRSRPPEWLIEHSQDIAYIPKESINLPGVGRFRLAGRYPFSGVSGWSWFVYHREGG